MLYLLPATHVLGLTAGSICQGTPKDLSGAAMAKVSSIPSPSTTLFFFHQCIFGLSRALTSVSAPEFPGEESSRRWKVFLFFLLLCEGQIPHLSTRWVISGILMAIAIDVMDNPRLFFNVYFFKNTSSYTLSTEMSRDFSTP